MFLSRFDFDSMCSPSLRLIPHPESTDYFLYCLHVLYDLRLVLFGRSFNLLHSLIRLGMCYNVKLLVCLVIPNGEAVPSVDVSSSFSLSLDILVDSSPCSLDDSRKREAYVHI